MAINIIKKINILTLSLILASLLLAGSVFGQTSPEFLISWKANTYVPADYQGKALATRGSQIEVAFELIDNGRIADVSSKEIRWFVNFNLADKGVGKQNFVFNHDPYSGRDAVIKIEVIDYSDQRLKKTFTIPIAPTEVIIDTVDQRNFTAKPYFFNVDGLVAIDFDWVVNGIKATEETEKPDTLTLEIPELGAGGFLDVIIDLTARNRADILEFAEQSLRLNLQP